MPGPPAGMQARPRAFRQGVREKGFWDKDANFKCQVVGKEDTLPTQS